MRSRKLVSTFVAKSRQYDHINQMGYDIIWQWDVDDDNSDFGLSGYFGIFPLGKDTGSDYLAGSLISLNISSMSSLERKATAVSTTSRVKCGAKR